MFQFEGYTLDVARHSLRAADREVALRPKSFKLLRYLVENPDRLVTKEELLKAIWPNVVVTDESLTHCIRDVRQAIGDSQQTVIATVPRHGYRFAAPVVRVTASAAAMPPPYAAPSPPVEGRVGGSGGWGPKVSHSSTPDPSPQGGGEQGRVRAPPASPDSAPRLQSPQLDRQAMASGTQPITAVAPACCYQSPAAMPPETPPSPQSRHPSLDAATSRHVVRTPSNVHACAARPTTRRYPTGSRMGRARPLRGDRRHRSAAIASTADAAMRLTSALGQPHASVAVRAPDRRGDHVGLACPLI
jgi:DNA-binding winged helix-turn-helix (wHTH) protein